MAAKNKKSRGRDVNRSDLAEINGVSMPTIDDWVRRGCPVVQRGGRGRAWQFNTADVRNWREDDKQRRWERAMRDSKRVGDTFGKMVGNIGRLGRQVGLGLTAAGAGIFALTSSTAAYGDKVAKTAGKLGIGIEALQEFRYAAERSGVSTESFDSSLTAMQKRLGEAAKGTGAAKKVLDQLGLSAKELVKIGPENAMAAIADKLRDIESPAERAAIAAALFSRSGIGMVNMLGGGSEALQQLRDDARKTGYVLSKEAARDAEAFADAQLDAQLVVKGLKNTIGAEFMPVVTRSMKQFSAWAVENREDVAAFANTAVTRLEAALPVIGQVTEGKGIAAGRRARGWYPPWGANIHGVPPPYDPELFRWYLLIAPSSPGSTIFQKLAPGRAWSFRLPKTSLKTHRSNAHQQLLAQPFRFARPAYWLLTSRTGARHRSGRLPSPRRALLPLRLGW